LYYEWLVGKVFNQLPYPLFIKTYGIYKYDSVEDKNALLLNENPIPALQRLQVASVEDTKTPELLCLAIQNIPTDISLQDLLDRSNADNPEDVHEILCILYQIYYVLDKLKFNHNDLTPSNVLLLKVGYVQFHMGKSFTCKYIAKAIDYGRSFVGFTQETLPIDTNWSEIGEQYCPRIDLTCILACMARGFVSPKFIEESNRDYTDDTDPIFTGEVKCAQTAFIKTQNVVYRKQKRSKKKLPTINDVCPFLMDKIDSKPVPIVCTITVDPFKVEWTSPKRAGKKTKKRKL